MESCVGVYVWQQRMRLQVYFWVVNVNILYVSIWNVQQNYVLFGGKGGYIKENIGIQQLDVDLNGISGRVRVQIFNVFLVILDIF